MQQLACHALELLAVLSRQRQVGLHQHVEHGQFFLGQLFLNVTLLFLLETLGEIDQLIEEDLRVACSGVPLVDQPLELLQVVDADAVPDISQAISAALLAVRTLCGPAGKLLVLRRSPQ